MRVSSAYKSARESEMEESKEKNKRILAKKTTFKKGKIETEPIMFKNSVSSGRLFSSEKYFEPISKDSGEYYPPKNHQFRTETKSKWLGAKNFQ